MSVDTTTTTDHCEKSVETIPGEQPARAVDDESSADSHAFVETDQLDVHLCFQVGELSLPFQVLRQLGSGDTFNLDKKLTEQAVSIYANGSLIALGELVCIGELVGVRITRMAQPADGS